MTEDEIKKEADKFFEEHFRPLLKKFEIECPICTACNCINNETCIKCGRPLGNEALSED